jgi:hypothetical protein
MQMAKQMKHNIPELLRFAQKGNKKCTEPMCFVPERWGWAVLPQYKPKCDESGSPQTIEAGAPGERVFQARRIASRVKNVVKE